MMMMELIQLKKIVDYNQPTYPAMVAEWSKTMISQIQVEKTVT